MEWLLTLEGAFIVDDECTLLAWSIVRGLSTKLLMNVLGLQGKVLDRSKGGGYSMALRGISRVEEYTLPLENLRPFPSSPLSSMMLPPAPGGKYSLPS